MLRRWTGVLLGCVALGAQGCSGKATDAGASGGEGGASGGAGGSAGAAAAGGAAGATNVGGAAGAASSGGGGAGSGGSSAGNGGGAGAAGCLPHYPGQKRPLDMLLLVDRSGSMEGASWAAMRRDLSTFVQSPQADGVGVGLQFFPLVNEPGCPIFPPCGEVCTQSGIGCALCDANAFLPLVVNIAPLPGVASQITLQLNGTSPSGGTPTMPALESAAIAATAHAKQHPERKVIIVLASDGGASGCNEDINAIAGVAGAALASVPSVSTFAISIGSVAALDTIAAQGGTGKALVVDMASAGQSLLDAMNAIRGDAQGCEFLVPTPSSGDADPDKLNVLFTPAGGGTEETFPRVSDATQCQGQAGWYYDDPTAPSVLVLCPNSCDRVKGLGGEVNIELGCEQIIAPPR